MTEQAASAPRYVEAMPITEIVESKHNPRKHFDADGLKELERSIREKGVLTPLLVRPNGGKGQEIAAGHRRFRAAKAAGLQAVPVIVRDMTDPELIEVLVIENDQREDVHPLEEASGYLALMRTAKYDVARIAERIGRSPKYVYDRLKLLELIPKAQELFLAGKFEAGHAILLARLKPEDQNRAIDIEEAGNLHRLDGLFQIEHSELPFEDEDGRASKKTDPYAEVKAVSVREFERWIHDSIRAEPVKVDPFLFPETAAVLDAHAEDKLAAILITREYRASDEVREAGKERIFGVNSWKRADGQEKSKTCDRSRVGFVACGPGQGEAFLVCVNKEKCEIHYGTEIRAREKRRKEAAKGGAPAQRAHEDRGAEQRKWEERRKREEAERLRWLKARPAILEAIAVAVKKAPTKADGLLAKLVINRLDSEHHSVRSKDVEKLVPRGKSAEDLLRHAAMIIIAAQGHGGWRAESELVPVARTFQVDAKKIRDEVAPAPKVQTSAKPGTCRKCGCTDGSTRPRRSAARASRRSRRRKERKSDGQRQGRRRRARALEGPVPQGEAGASSRPGAAAEDRGDSSGHRGLCRGA